MSGYTLGTLRVVFVFCVAVDMTCRFSWGVEVVPFSPTPASSLPWTFLDSRLCLLGLIAALLTQSTVCLRGTVNMVRVGDCHQSDASP